LLPHALAGLGARDAAGARDALLLLLA